MAGMAKVSAPLKVEIPRPGEDQPIWSRVGIVAALGFVLGLAWPKLAGVKIGPSVPVDLRPESSASVASAPKPSLSGAPSASAAAPTASASASAAPAAPANQQSVVIGPGKIVKCVDKKDKKIDDCEKLQLDPVVVPKLRELAKCPAVIGLDGKVAIGIEVNFEKKEVQVSRPKKDKETTNVPGSTVKGVLQCAGKELAGIALDEVPHKYRKYSLVYPVTFYPPGKHPEEAKGDDDKGDEPAAGATSNETGATGSATVSWDTALVRKDPKEGEVVARIVRGTKVKILAKQNDWYKVETGGKTGWVYRGSIGM
jgi:hypothetical protein